MNERKQEMEIPHASLAGTRHASPVPDPRRILVRGVNWLGDAVMTTPALGRLRERFPRAHIAILTPEKLSGLWLHHPSIDAAISFSAAQGLQSVSRTLRSEFFDTALLLPNSPRAALETWLAGIPRRVGYSRPWRNWLLTQVVRPRAGHASMRKRSTREVARLIRRPAMLSPAPRSAFPQSAHQIYEYLDLVAALGGSPAPLPPLLNVTSAETAAAAHRFGLAADLERRVRPVFGLNPGAEYGPAKRWPRERFIAAAAELQNRTNCLWLIFGGDSDLSLAREIADGILSSAGPSARPELAPALNLAGKTTLRELCALLKLCQVVLTNDTGPMHVAAALGTPVVVPFGSTSARLTAPGLPGEVRHRLIQAEVPCAPCFRRVCPIDFRCMTSITVERVIEAVLQAVTSSEPPGRPDLDRNP